MNRGQGLILNGEIILTGMVMGDEELAYCDEVDGVFTPQMVREALQEFTGTVTVRLTSSGGYVYAGEAIRSMLARHPGGVKIIVEGIAASAASLIFMAGQPRVMSEGSILMIHDPSNISLGTEADMLRDAAVLGYTADTYAAVYATAAGIGTDEARAIMRAETWYNAADAIAAGFADEVLALPAAAARMSVDGARAAFATMRHGLATRLARKNTGAQTASGPSAAAGGFPAVMAASEEAVMPDNVLPAATVATLAPVMAAVTVSPEATATEIVMAERQRQRDIRMMAAPFLLSTALVAADVEALIDNGTSAADAGQRFMTTMAATQPTIRRPGAVITRDEGDTLRAGIASALSAQLCAKDLAPADPGMAFMNVSICEMAAKLTGFSGSLRTPGARQQVLMNATLSRGDFTGIFENALNKALLDRYEVQLPTYREIARIKSFNDFRAHPMVRTGDYPRLKAINEGGEIKFGTFGEKRETAVLTSYGTGLRISRQMLIDDEMGAIADLIGDYGSMISDYEEETFYTFMGAAVLASDGLAVWLTAATRLNLAAAGTAINVNSLSAAKAAMRKQVSIDGSKLNIMPMILLVGPDKETEAQQLVTSLTPAQSTNVNPFSGTLKVVVSAQITGNTWYLFADPARRGGQCFVYGYLNGAEAPRVRTDEPFGQQGWAMTVEHDFGLGAVDFRGTYKNAGA